MPNTLIHIAVQTPISRRVFGKIEIPWILAGAILPDIPWIFQRIVTATQLAEPYQLRSYVTIQASLFFCLVLSTGLAFFARRPKHTFAMLAFNCIMHLLLDALQIKWGNGVHFFIPFSWQPTNFGILWPEHFFGYIAALLGVVYLVLKTKTILHEGLRIILPTGSKMLIVLLSLLFYLFFPLSLIDQLEESNSNHIQTLRQKEGRPGKYIELDRAHYSEKDEQITIFSRESITLTGNKPDKSGTISIKGEFTAPHIIRSSTFHLHNDYRNNASYIGLFLSFFIWGYLLVIRRTDNITTE